MSLREIPHITYSNPGGVWLRPEPGDVPITQSLLHLNGEYDPGNAGTRRGFGVAFDPSEPMSSLFDWVSSAGNYLLWFNPSTHKLRLATAAGLFQQDLYTQAGAAGAVIASNGTRVFSATFDSNGLGVGQCRVIGNVVSAFNVDKAFLGPLTTKPTLSNTGTGSVTAGLKRAGYIIQTRNGFLGRISPIDATTNMFDTTSTITATGGQQITFAVNPATWPTEADRIWFVLTTAANLDRYFIVPNAPEIHVPGGMNFPVSVTLDISDADLASTGTDVTTNNLLFTQDQSGLGPFEPFSVGSFGSRTIYLAELSGISQGYASESDNAQSITADQLVFYLPGQRQMKAQGEQGQILYILGPNWTYAFEDTGDVPVSWPSPRLVDGFIGTSATRGFTINASTGLGWAAHTTGFYPFQGGAYAPRPVSYMVESDWKRINWAVSSTLQVVDDKNRQRACVLAALDSNTTPSHILVFDYTDGLTPETVKYSLWNLASYLPGAMCLVQNPTTGQLEIWLGDSAAGPILRQKSSTDANPFNDNSHGIDWQFQTAILPGLDVDLGTVWYHYAVQVRATGLGTLHTTAYSLDNVTSQAITNITLSPNPGGVYTHRYPRLRSEGASYRFTNGAVADAHCVLSGVDHYYGQGPDRR